ncbi:DUF84 family protein [Bacillaceae bacterium]
MLRVAVGSRNPAKVEAARAAFCAIGLAAEVAGIAVPSGVPPQPFSDEETIRGAINRAKAALACGGEAPYDYGIGLEGGVVETEYGMFVCNWGAVVDREGTVGIGGGHRVQLPPAIASAVRAGKELGEAVKEWAEGESFHRRDGAIGFLTRNAVTREAMFRDVVICAFSRFLQPAVYAGKRGRK